LTPYDFLTPYDLLWLLPDSEQRQRG